MTDFAGKSRLAQSLVEAIDRVAQDIRAIGDEIFENPEPPHGELRAAGLLTDFLSGAGFEVETGLAGMPTAFLASVRNFDSEAMRKGLRHGHVAILAEYDAGPDGHREGRSLVAAGALSAAAGLAETLSGVNGQVMVFGCPAATTREGKRRLAAAGVFEVADAALGAAPANGGKGFQSTIVSTGETLAIAIVSVRLSGGDALEEARQSLVEAIDPAAVREQDDLSDFKVVPTDEGVRVEILARSTPVLVDCLDRVTELANEVAGQHSLVVDVTVDESCPAFNVNRILARRIKTYADTLVLKQDPIVKSLPARPSDWGHVSLVTPTVLGAYPVADFPVEQGTDSFAEACRSDFAHQQMLTCAKAIALTGLDLLGDMEFRGFAEGELIRATTAQGLQRTPRRWLGVHPVKPREASNGRGTPDSPISTQREESS